MPAGPEHRPTHSHLRAAIVGGGQGGASFIRMAAEDKFRGVRLRICGLAEPDVAAPGMRVAREHDVPLVTDDFRRLFAIPDLDLVIELTGRDDVRDELERERPRHVRLIDHFAAQLFWELSTADDAIIRHRIEMQQRVAEEKDWVSQIFDSLPEEIVVMDHDMVVTHVNRAFLVANGVTLEQVRGRHCYELEQRARGECRVSVEGCPFQGVIETRRPQMDVRKHLAPDGHVRYAAITAAPLLARDGAPKGVIESTQDITERVRLEEELRATEVRLQQFMEMAPLSICIKNPAGQYLEINPAGGLLLGRSKHEILGRTDREILSPAAAEVFRASDREVLQQRRQVSVDQDVELRGSRISLATVKYPVLDGAGNVTAVCGMSKDVTALKQAELELTRTKDYLQNILENSPVMIITADLEGRVVSFNRAAEATLGYRREEVIGRPAAMFYGHPEERETLVRRVRTEGSIQEVDTAHHRKDGVEVPVSLTFSVLKDSQGRPIGTVGISRDISHRKALMNQVLQSERLAAVGRLAAGVAHEVNNPVAVISEVVGYLQDLIEDDPACRSPELVEEIRDSLPKIQRQVVRCRSITQRLLAFSRKSAATGETVAVNAAVEEILPFLEKEAFFAKVTLHRDFAPDLPRVRMDEMQLQEIVINLGNNAVQAIGKRGWGNVWVTTALREGRVIVAVRDDGPGISEQVRDRLFDPFVTSKPPGQGTGLGLSICYAIAKRHDGEITVESTPGAGATFRVFLRPVE
ncbi:MAG: PAS domain S-box protein [Deltaproteobacteria bacterium]|nr:PAS domain S-box protein [Deltaproteobacteria bacterium]